GRHGEYGEQGIGDVGALEDFRIVAGSGSGTLGNVVIDIPETADGIHVAGAGRSDDVFKVREQGSGFRGQGSGASYAGRGGNPVVAIDHDIFDPQGSRSQGGIVIGGNLELRLLDLGQIERHIRGSHFGPSRAGYSTEGIFYQHNGDRGPSRANGRLGAEIAEVGDIFRGHFH